MTTQDLAKRPSRKITRRTIGGAVLALFCPIALGAGSSNTLPAADAQAAPGVAGTTDIDQSKQQLIRALVNLTESPQVQAVFSQQLINRVSSALSMFGPTLSPQTMAIVQQQTRAVVAEHIQNGDALYSVLAPIYEKHFNLIELNKLVNFYRSPLGQKLVRVSPQLLTETLDLGSKWGLSLVPEIVRRVQQRINNQPAGSTDGQSH